MAVLIDTDVLIDTGRAGSSIEDLAGDEDRAISVITVSELLRGVHRAHGATRHRRLAFAEHLLASLSVVPISTPVARLHAEIHAELSAAGRQVGAHDLWIAATALAHGFGVVTRNSRDFTNIPGLRILEA